MINFLSFLPTIIIGLSFCGIATLFVVKIYGVRNLKKEELHEGIIYSEPFFKDFNHLFSPFVGFSRDFFEKAKKIFEKLFYGVSCVFIAKLKFYHCRLANFLHGRHTLKNNGCAGYWHELNQCKNGSPQSATNENKEEK